MEVLSSYEQMRRENIERNNALLQSLSIEKPQIPAPQRKGIKRKLERSSEEPQRRSARLVNKPVEHVALPANFSDPPLRRPMLKSIKRVRPAEVAEPDEEIDYSVRQPLPTRRGDGTLHFATHPYFTPNMTPKEVIQLGSFGGTYFSTVKSRVTGETYTDDYKEFPTDWFAGLDKAAKVLNEEYTESVNNFGVKAGQGLRDWEDAGWVAAQDPRGWFQWYCRFYMGRRSVDDERQIARWIGVAGPNGRWKKDLVLKIVRSGKAWDDRKVSPVVRQTLQHWAYKLTNADYQAFL